MKLSWTPEEKPAVFRPPMFQSLSRNLHGSTWSGWKGKEHIREQPCLTVIQEGNSGTNSLQTRTGLAQPRKAPCLCGSAEMKGSKIWGGIEHLWRNQQVNPNHPTSSQWQDLPGCFSLRLYQWGWPDLQEAFKTEEHHASTRMSRSIICSLVC